MDPCEQRTAARLTHDPAMTTISITPGAFGNLSHTVRYEILDGEDRLLSRGSKPFVLDGIDGVHPDDLDDEIAAWLRDRVVPTGCWVRVTDILALED